MNTNQITNYEILDEDQFVSTCKHDYAVPNSAKPGESFITFCKKCGENTLATLEATQA